MSIQNTSTDNEILAIEKVKHDSKCSKSWKECDCDYSSLIKDSHESLAKGITTHVIFAFREGRITVDNDNRPFLAPKEDIEEQERMKMIYLRNHGIKIALKSLDEIGTEGIAERISELDEALQDRAFAKLRAKKDSLQESINKLRTIQQGVIIATNQLYGKMTEAQRLMQERKDKVFKIPKNLASSGKPSTQDVLKQREKRVEKAKTATKESFASMGIDFSKLMDGLKNAGQKK